MSSPDVVLAVEGLTRRFGDRTALDAVDLTLRRGATLGIFGPNGSGKTTLLKVLATLVRPTAGRVEVCGHALPRAAGAVRACMGVLFEQPPLPRDFRLDEGLRYLAELHQVPAPAACIERWVARAGLTWRMRDPLRTFSRGLLQRVALIGALLADPELLLLDEPFTALDRTGCGWVEAVIEERRAVGWTTLVVTHDLERGSRVCDEALVLESGRVRLRAGPGQWRSEDLA